MAGKPGRSGGYRPGAGRKPPEVKLLPEIVEALEAKLTQTPLEFLLSVMRNPGVDEKLRIDAAKAAATYMHVKPENTIKADKQDAAKKAATGKFGAAAPPLRVVNGR